MLMRKIAILILTLGAISTLVVAGMSGPRIKEVRVAYSSSGQEVQIVGSRFGAFRKDGKVLMVVGDRTTPTGRIRVWTDRMIIVHIPNEIRINTARVQVVQNGIGDSYPIAARTAGLVLPAGRS